ncbi:MAG: hypothetical protein NUV50_04895 [Rhodospirillales bacterium]|nr:hypothetical protein [Rhodospirillales bacterium]
MDKRSIFTIRLPLVGGKVQHFSLNEFCARLGKLLTVWLLASIIALGHGAAAAAPAFNLASNALVADGIVTATDICVSGSSPASPSSDHQNQHKLCVFHCTLTVAALTPEAWPVVQSPSTAYYIVYPWAVENQLALSRYLVQTSRDPPFFS